MAHTVAHRRHTLSPVAAIRWLVDLVSGIIFVLLALRFVFQLLGANTGSGFVNWVYESSYPLVRPFQGIFSIPEIEGVSVFDVTTLLAMLIYGIVLYFIHYALEGIEEARLEKTEIHHDDM